MPKSEQTLYERLGAFVRANHSATPSKEATDVVGWKALVAFSDFLGLPQDISGVTPKFVISEQEVQVFHALCDPANVRPITKSHFEDAMNSVLEHIDQDRKEATLAGLVRVAPGAAPGSAWRQLEGLLDTARVPVVSEAVKLSTDIEAIVANDTSKQIELLQDSNNPTRYDRLVAVSEVAFAQPPKPGTNNRISSQEFVSDLAGLQSDGRADLVRDVLDGNPNPNGGVWSIHDALEQSQALDDDDADAEVGL